MQFQTGDLTWLLLVRRIIGRVMVMMGVKRDDSGQRSKPAGLIN